MSRSPKFVYMTFMYDNHTFHPLDHTKDDVSLATEIYECFLRDNSGSVFIRVNDRTITELSAHMPLTDRHLVTIKHWEAYVAKVRTVLPLKIQEASERVRAELAKAAAIYSDMLFLQQPPATGATKPLSREDWDRYTSIKIKADGNGVMQANHGIEFP